MPDRTHRIRKLRCTIATGDRTGAFTLRKNLHDRWQEIFLPVLDRAFEEIGNDDRTLHIPKLEFRLQIPADGDLLAILPEILYRQLREQLRSLDRASLPTSTANGIAREITARQNRFEILLHYLRTGSIPWQVASESASEISIELRETCQQERSSLLNALETRSACSSASLPPAPAFYFRWFQLLPETEIVPLLETLAERFFKLEKAIILQLIQFILDSPTIPLNNPDRIHLIAEIVALASRSNSLPSPDLDTAIDRSLSKTGIDLPAFRTYLPVPVARWLSDRSNPTASLSNNPLETQEIQPLSHENTISPQISPSNENRTLDREIGALDRDSPFPPEIPATETKFPLSVFHTGLILLHPFLTTLFDAAGITEPDGIGHRDRAATLLYFLATGREDLHEYELGLIKILLGLEPETPLFSAAGTLREIDRSEAETVLHSAIHYWNVLKNTSIEGLRSSFLQRPGLLRKTENGWLLQIEPRAFDLLLQHLPWSIGIIKLPRMKSPLYTEWQTF
ncbi:contractile injection system tape measure protein [Pannus brasiliensis CCIBt3594]|uniref:Contractile injection system tape measure protein n=1 Tax=Pannus brasiliensis CCIBt3594 TaxID=1427578 RepID=A0AAW9QKJ1_9CHRO